MEATANAKAGWRAPGPLLIGELTADPAANELHRDGTTVRVRPLLMDVLLRLAATPGEVVTREQLIADVWPRRMVNDEVLSRAIGELRTLLADDAREPRYIETLPKVGYRLIATVSASSPESAQRAPGTHKPAPRRWAGPAIGVASFVVGAVIAAMIVAWLRADDAAYLAKQLGRAESFAADADPEFGPRFSPDGARVIYAQLKGRESVLVVRDLSGNVLERIAKPGTLLLAPVFLPDGKRIVFWRAAGDDCAIVERDLDSGGERPIVGCAGTPRTVTDVSPDGTWLAVSLRARPQHPYGIARVAIADGKVEMLTSPQPGDGDDARPRISPDGSRIVWSRGNNSHGRLWLLEIAKPQSARPLEVPEGLDYGAAWMGRDGPLLVAADWAGFRALIRVDPRRGDIDLVGARGARFPDVSRSGDIVFEAATYRADLWLTDADNPGAKTELMWPSSRYTNQPVFSPDGKEVVFVSNREGAESLYVASLGGGPRRLTASTEYRHVRPNWSPDGKWLYAMRSPVSARQSGPHQAVRIDPATGASEVLAAYGEDVAELVPLADGDMLFAEKAGNAMRLARVSGVKTERLPLPLVNEFQVAGDDLVYMQPDLPTVTRCSLSTMRCAPLPVQVGDADRYHWHLAPGVLWHRASGDAGAKLLRLDLATGESRAFDFVPTGAGTSLAASPDGKKLIVTREAPTVVDLMLARKGSLLP